MHGLTGARLAVLARLDSGASLSLSDLATAEGVTVPTMARIVNSLEEGRLVTRVPSTDDRRKVLVVPTTLGRSLARGSQRRRSVWLASYLNRLSDADRATIARQPRFCRVHSNGPCPDLRLVCSLTTEVSERLVGFPVFKTGEGPNGPWRVRFPSTSATAPVDPARPVPSPAWWLAAGRFDSPQ